MSEEARYHLLARVALLQQRSSARVDIAATTQGKSARVPPTEVTGLPGYEQLKLERDIAQRYGLANPWFRVHQGRAGARTVMDGRELINFASYDYLGINGEPELADAAKRAIDIYGVSASGSRHVSGSRPVHLALEKALADHYGVADSITFVGGYVTNVGCIGQMMGPKDLIVSDAMIHNSALTGAVLSGAARRSFAHNDIDALDRLLAMNRSKFQRVLILVEGLYSMDGDVPDLARLIDVKRRHEAWLMVDEAHALGTLGPTGRGSFEACGIDPRAVDLWMGTLSKTLAGCGGYIAGAREVVDYLRCTTGAFVYSVALPPVIAATTLKALELLHRGGDRVSRLAHNGQMFRDLARRRGLQVGGREDSPIVPVRVGDSVQAVILSQRLLDRGINVQPVTYPGVPAGTERLRFFLTALHSDADLEAAVEATSEELKSRRSTTVEAAAAAIAFPGARLGEAVHGAP